MNMFLDRAILRVPRFVRPFLARWIVHSRLPVANANYALLGGRSPLLELTRAQAVTLQAALSNLNVRCFIAMRYWHPLTPDTVRAVKAWRPDKVVLLPLYPQFSTTTTDSSLLAWHESAAQAGLIVQTRAVCCYPIQPEYVAALTHRAKQTYIQARCDLAGAHSLRILFSAHGLPESIVRNGDPYQWQIEQTVRAILAVWGDPELDWTICYQSRATPQKWLGPSTEAEIERAAHDKIAILVVPVAFVSEHSETLVELDIEYRSLAESLGVPAYYRAPALGTDPAFIQALANLARGALTLGAGLHRAADAPRCPMKHGCCACSEVT